MIECLTRHEYGASGWCQNGSHNRCAHRPGGPCEHGNPSAHGYLTMPRKDAVLAVVSEPRIVWRCPCDCHGAAPMGQLDLFGTT